MSAELPLGTPEPFGFEALKARAREMAAKPYAPPAIPDRDVLQAIDYDAHGKLKFKPDHALWADGPSAFPVTFFHLGRYFQKPVRMHVVEGGQAREIVYDPAAFEMPADSRRGACRRIRALRVFASRSAAAVRSTGAATTGSPSSAPRISGRSANSTSTASRPGGSPSIR